MSGDFSGETAAFYARFRRGYPPAFTGLLARALGLGGRFVVRTWIEKFNLIGLRVQFEIDRQADGKRSCDGCCDYVMISVETARPVRIPEWILGKYSI